MDSEFLAFAVLLGAFFTTSFCRGFPKVQIFVLCVLIVATAAAIAVGLPPSP